MGEHDSRLTETLTAFTEQRLLNNTLLEAYDSAKRLGQETVESINELCKGKLKEALQPRLSKRNQKRFKTSSPGEMFGRRDLRKPILDALDSYASMHQDNSSLAAQIALQIQKVKRIAQYLEDRMGILVQANTRLIFQYLKTSGMAEKTSAFFRKTFCSVPSGRGTICHCPRRYTRNSAANISSPVCPCCRDGNHSLIATAKLRKLLFKTVSPTTPAVVG